MLCYEIIADFTVIHKKTLKCKPLVKLRIFFTLGVVMYSVTNML